MVVGTPAFGTSPAGLFPFPFWLPEYSKPFAFDVHDRSGRLIARLPTVSRPLQQYRLNSPPELKFSLPYDDATAVHPHNEVWVTNGQGAIEEKYTIIEREETDESSQEVSVVCVGFMAALAQEWVFDLPLDDYAVGTLLAALIALQVGDTPITVGTIHATVSAAQVQLEVTRPTTILSVLLQIEALLPFQSSFSISTDRALDWSGSLNATSNSDLILMGRNARGVRRRIRGDAQTTRLFAYGAASTDADASASRVRLSDAAGQSEDYVETAFVAYKFRKMLIIDHNDLPPQGTTNYSLSVIRAADEDLAAHAASDGSDIIFVAADEETELSSVINSYTSATGALDADVTVPFASGVQDTVLYLYFGI